MAAGFAEVLFGAIFARVLWVRWVAVTLVYVRSCTFACTPRALYHQVAFIRKDRTAYRQRSPSHPPPMSYFSHFWFPRTDVFIIPVQTSSKIAHPLIQFVIQFCHSYWPSSDSIAPISLFVEGYPEKSKARKKNDMSSHWLVNFLNAWLLFFFCVKHLWFIYYWTIQSNFIKYTTLLKFYGRCIRTKYFRYLQAAYINFKEQ